MSDKPWPQPTTKQKFQCLGWALLAVVALPLLFLLGLPATIAAWLKEHRDGFTTLSPEEAKRIHVRIVQKQMKDIIKIDGVPHEVAWVSKERDNPNEYLEIHLTDGYHILGSAESISVTREYPRWWFIKSSLRLNFKEIE